VRQATRQFWPGRIRIQNLSWVATNNIPILYVFEMIPLTGIEKSFTTADFRRQWVVRQWGEQSLGFFAASMSAYLLMAVGLVSRKLAERAVYSALILIFLGGVLGTGRDWAGGPSMRVPLGSMFSATMCSRPWRGSNRSRRCIGPTTSHQYTRLAKTHGFAVTVPTRHAASFFEAFLSIPARGKRRSGISSASCTAAGYGTAEQHQTPCDRYMKSQRQVNVEFPLFHSASVQNELAFDAPVTSR
jgi:hypothetical protein